MANPTKWCWMGTSSCSFLCSLMCSQYPGVLDDIRSHRLVNAPTYMPHATKWVWIVSRSFGRDSLPYYHGPRDLSHLTPAPNEYLPSSIFPSSTTWVKSGRHSTLTTIMPGPLDPDGPAPPDAILIAIGMVPDSAQLKVGPIGNWSAYAKETYKKDFEDAKYTFTILKPSTHPFLLPRSPLISTDNDPVFSQDFPLAVAALKKVQSQISATGNNKWLVVQDGAEIAIRFAFNVFDKKTETNGGTMHTILCPAPTNVRPDSIDIASWPVPSECREALENISETHVIRPFLVFDVKGVRVDPLDIATKITGALVECQFGVIHHGFPDNDSFSGLIQQITILRVPQVKPASPYKSANKPYRPPPLSPEEVHATEQRALSAFARPISSAGPSNLPVPTKRKASKEPEGSAPKRSNTDDDGGEGPKNDNNDSDKGKGKEL
ncbi:hypothetical protein C8R46DRAFT_1036257 [Mycena filopes]|nr:hypothetical protein C8R46DRAFT_1036257 [Mycena filopes]